MSVSTANAMVRALDQAVTRLPSGFARAPATWLMHPDTTVRDAALRAIGRCQAKAYGADLRRALHERAENDYSLQAAAAEAMADLVEPSFLDDLVTAWRDAELLNVRRIARVQIDRLLSALGLVGQPDGRVTLNALTRSFFYDVPARADYAAGTRPDWERILHRLMPRPLPPRQEVRSIIRWVTDRNGPAAPTAVTEEMADLLIGFCRCRQLPARPVFLTVSGAHRSRPMLEVAIDGDWRLFDPGRDSGPSVSAWEWLTAAGRESGSVPTHAAIVPLAGNATLQRGRSRKDARLEPGVPNG